MSTSGDAPNEVQFHYVLQCPCGTTLTGLTEDEIVEVSVAHLREKHPDLADDYEREHILFMAQRLVRPRADGP
jgi:hypothetical protein